MQRLTAPFIRMGKGEKSFFLPVALLLCAVLLMSFFLYGPRILLLALCAVGTALVLEYAFNKISRRDTTIWDGSAIVTGLIITCLCPASAPYWLPVVGTAFAILVAKMPFGGVGRNIFNPAAAGWCAMACCFPAHMFTYPSLDKPAFLSLANTPDLTTAPCITELLSSGTLGGHTAIEILLCRLNGPLGCTATLVILACGICLVQNRIASLWTPLGFLASAAILSAIFLRGTNSMLLSILFELSGGSLLFCAVFMTTDPVTTPKLNISRFLFGFLGGILTMLLRYIGIWEQGAPLAILIMNPTAPILDYFILRAKGKVGALKRSKI